MAKSSKAKVSEDLAHHSKLTELPATAICGNDISSSCLYVSALAIVYSGQYAPLALLIVAVVLYLFRNIYGEVVGALPLNGGAYNALLNTTSKQVASLAACLTLLSYMATAVISGSEAMHYLHNLWHGLPVFWATVILLSIFMVLTIIGIGESSMVAVVIFIFHLVSLTVLVGACTIWIAQNGLSQLIENFQIPTHGSITMALFFGFSAAMLGISGFESSSNFVEEQAPGVFPKTLRNMWVVVSVFNPLLALLVLAVIPMEAVGSNQNALLAFLGNEAAGSWLSTVISIDAIMVLSGAVLTSYVGVGGLVQRMTLDRIMPQYLLKLNKKGSPYRIMVSFFILSSLVLLATYDGNFFMDWGTQAPGDDDQQLQNLAGIYTISFLSVMILFGIGNILLKVKRDKLPRPVKAKWAAVIVAILAVATALVGQVNLNPRYVVFFLSFFLPTVGLVWFMLYRVPILRALLSLIRYISEPIRKWVMLWNISVTKRIESIKSQEFVFFTKGDNVASLNRVMQYIENNEHTKKIKIVTILQPEGELIPGLLSDIEVLDRTYPDIDIEFISMQGEFGPELITELSDKWNIPKNFMFIGSPGDRFPYRIEELGGVRLII